MMRQTLYDDIGLAYARFRRPDPRIATVIDAALGDAATVANVGAGAGSYEPAGRTVIAVEPSEVMIRQRSAGAAPCVQGRAEALPLETGSVDAAMAVLSLHHWTDPELGLKELARAARRSVVILTWVPDGPPFWLTEDYFPEIAALDRQIFPGEEALGALLARTIGPADIISVLIPHDCVDGFQCAYWRRPQAYLDAQVRSGISSFARIDAGPGLEKLAADLSSGRWMERNGRLMDREAMDFGYRLARCELA